MKWASVGDWPEDFVEVGLSKTSTADFFASWLKICSAKSLGFTLQFVDR